MGAAPPAEPPPGRGRSGSPFISAILLAAGASSRMRGRDKLLEPVEGEALLRRAAGALLESRAAEVVVVLRPEDAARREALSGLDVRIVENELAAEGMGASIRAGMAAIAARADAALIALADMPEIGAPDIDALIAGFAPEDGREIIRAAAPDGAPGNPVLFGRRFFAPLRELTGDAGARRLIAAHPGRTALIPLRSHAARVDLDTPEEWAAWRARRQPRS